MTVLGFYLLKEKPSGYFIISISLAFIGLWAALVLVQFMLAETT